MGNQMKGILGRGWVELEESPSGAERLDGHIILRKVMWLRIDKIYGLT